MYALNCPWISVPESLSLSSHNSRCVDLPPPVKLAQSKGVLQGKNLTVFAYKLSKLSSCIRIMFMFKTSLNCDSLNSKSLRMDWNSLHSNSIRINCNSLHNKSIRMNCNSLHSNSIRINCNSLQNKSLRINCNSLQSKSIRISFKSLRSKSLRMNCDNLHCKSNQSTFHVCSH